MFLKLENCLEAWLPEAPSPLGLLCILSGPRGSFVTLGTKLQVSRRPAGPLKPLGKLTGPVQFLGVLGVSKGLWGPYSSQVLQVIQVFRKWLSKSPKRHFEFH